MRKPRCPLASPEGVKEQPPTKAAIADQAIRGAQLLERKLEDRRSRADHISPFWLQPGERSFFGQRHGPESSRQRAQFLEGQLCSVDLGGVVRSDPVLHRVEGGRGPR